MRGLWFGVSAALSLAASQPALAQDFYAGKTITMLVGSATGGGYDLYSRLIARYWTNYIPGNPSIVIRNMPAAGSLVAMNTMANASPTDGTVGLARARRAVNRIATARHTRYR